MLPGVIRRSGLAVWCGLMAACVSGPSAVATQDQQPSNIPRPQSSAQRSPEEKAIRACLDFLAGISTVQWYKEYGRTRGWASRYGPDQVLRHGHAGQPIPDDVVCLQSPGTVTMGQLYLLAYPLVNEPTYLERANEVGQLLLAAQTEAGGWGKELWIGRTQVNTIRTGSGTRAWSSDDPGIIRGDDTADLEGAATSEAMDFLYQLWWVTRDERYLQAYRKALDFLLVAQEAAGGGFPEIYPAEDYRARASFYGEATLAAVRSLQLGYERTGQQKYLDAIIRCADWLLTVRAFGQGWGMRYDDQGQLVGGRVFEPPGLCSESTLFAIMILGIAREYTAEQRYLAAIQDAAKWLRLVPAPQGISARFYHPDSNKPWFVDGAGQEVRGPKKARKDYIWIGYWGRMGLDLAEGIAKAKIEEPRQVPQGGDPAAQALLPLPSEIPALVQKGITVQKLLESQAHRGAWLQDVDGTEMLSIGGTANRLRLLLAEIAKKRAAQVKTDSPG